MQRRGYIAMTVVALAALLSQTDAQAETNSMLAVSLRTFPSDHLARRAQPHCEPRARIGRLSRPSYKAAAIDKPAETKTASTKVALVSKSQAPAATVPPTLPEPVKPASKPGTGVTASVPVEAAPVPASTRMAALNEPSTRTKSVVVAPGASPAPAPSKPAPVASVCRKFVPAAGLMVDVPCEK